MLLFGVMAPYSTATAGPILPDAGTITREAPVAPAGDAITPAQSVDDFFCNYDANHPGVSSVGIWLGTAGEGQNTDCIDVGVEVVGCGFLQVPITDYVTGTEAEPDLNYWIEFDEVDGPRGATVLPAEGFSWPEDYNNGSVKVQVYIGGPEQDYVDFANEAEWAYPGKTITIDTDCEEPVPVNYCDYSQIDTPYSVATWLGDAPEGADTDCIDVGVVVEACGSVTIPLTETVEPFDYWIEYVEGTDLSGETFVAEDGLIAFPEGYNDGSVTVTVYIGGPEQDYVDYANEGEWAYPGKTITIDTDCAQPEEDDDVTPDPVVPPVDEDEEDVVPGDDTPATTPDVDDADDADTDTAAAEAEDEETPAVTTLPSTGSGDGSQGGTWTSIAGLMSAMLMLAALGMRRVTTRA